MIQGLQDIIENQIMMDLQNYNNLSYLGMYTDGNEAKYVIDIGFTHIALCFYYGSGLLSTGLCKKDNIDNLETLCTLSRVSLSLSDNKLGLNCLLRVISHDSEAKVIFGLYDNGYRENVWFAIDTDSFDRTYIAYGIGNSTTTGVYYDSDTYNLENLADISFTNNYDMQALIQKSIIVKDNTVMSGMSNNLLAIRNDSIESDLLLIDIEGVRYRNLSGYRWYVEN
jgi:hypothetical protein